MSEQSNTTGRAVVPIGSVQLPVIEVGGQRVVTLGMVDKVHGRPEGTAKRNFGAHKARLVYGEDYVEVTGDEIRSQSLTDIFPPRTPKGVLLTETGYLMLVKSLTDDTAWDVQRKLVKTYFQAKAVPPTVLTPDLAKALMPAVAGLVLAEFRASLRADVASEVEQIVMARGLSSGQHRTSLEYQPAVFVVDSANVPKRGRHGLVRKASNALDRFCRREGAPVRSEAYTDRRLFHVDAIARWLAAEGKAMIQRHMDRLAGQTVMQFPKATKKPGLRPVARSEEGA